MSNGGKNPSKQQDAAKKRGLPQRRVSLSLIFAALVAVALAAAIPYLDSLDGEFFFDNSLIIVKNPIITLDTNFNRIFTTNYWAYIGNANLYRPLTLLTYWWQYHTFKAGNSPFPYHFVNFVLHIVNSMLVFLVLLRLARVAGKFADDGANLVLALVGGAVFATHPINTEAVSNIVGRADLLVMFLFLCGFLLHTYGSRREGPLALLFYAPAALCQSLGMFCKENAIALIALCAAFDLLFVLPRRGQVPAGEWLLKRAFYPYGLYAVGIVLWLIPRYFVLRDLDLPLRPAYVDNPLAYIPFLQREATAIVVLGVYLWKMLWPATLAADYAPEQIPPVESPFQSIGFILSLAALVVILVILVRCWRRYPLVSFFILVFFAFLAPVSNIGMIIGTIAAERFLYTASLGWAGVVGLGAAYLFARAAKTQYGLALGGVLAGALVLAVLYGWRTWERNIDWQTEKRFWLATYEASPLSVRAIQGYAESIMKEQPEKSAELLDARS